jgi:DNA replication factor GINS
MTMNLDELQSIRDRERQSDTLQQLRETFYDDVGTFVQNLREEREAAAARADDPFDSPEVRQLTDDIKTAEQTVEAIYERRVGKLVKMASFAAADMPTEDEGLTAEERALFDDLVDAIEHNREQVFATLDGASVTAGSGEAASGGQEPGWSEGVDAADLMGGETDAATPADDATPADAATPADDATPADADRPAEADAGAGSDAGRTGDADSPEASRPAEEATAAVDADTAEDGPRDAPVAGGPSDAGTDGDETSDAGGSFRDESTSGAGDDDIDRTTVRITADVGEILGVDERAYDLSPDDVVTLPASNAEPLVERDAAERLE